MLELPQALSQRYKDWLIAYSSQAVAESLLHLVKISSDRPNQSKNQFGKQRFVFGLQFGAPFSDVCRKGPNWGLLAICVTQLASNPHRHNDVAILVIL